MGDVMQRSRGFVLFQAAVAVFCALYLEAAYEISGFSRTGIAAGLLFGTPTVGTVMRVGIAFLAIFVAQHLITRFSRVFDWIVEHRIVLGLALLGVLVLFEVSGSSIAMWGSYFGEDGFRGTLFGMPRQVRSDEWTVFTPFSLSQVATGGHPVSDVIRGGGTDVTMVYAQPSWCMATLFRPFLWGYLMLGGARGLSFFWCARAICLLLVTFECFLLLTGGRRRLSAYGAMLIGFAPIVEWWFAVNGTAELFIFGQGLVIALHQLLRADTPARRWLGSALLAWLLGCYAMIIYPAWQVPLTYVFGAMGIWVVSEWSRGRQREERRETLLRLLLPLITSVAVVAMGVGYSIWSASDALQAVSQSVYPGHRFEQGGGLAALLPNWTAAPVSPLWPAGFVPNVCESATFIALAPLGVLLSCVVLARGVRSKSPDVITILLLAVYALLMAYGIWGFPPLLAKVTLLSNVTHNRLPLPLGYLDVALLMRAISRLHANEADTAPAQNGANRGARACLSLAMLASASAALVLLAKWHAPGVVDTKAAAVLFAAFALLLTPFAASRHACDGTPGGRESWLATSALVVVVIGMCVNPIQRGTDSLTNNSMLQPIQEVAATGGENDLWVTDNATLGQACVSQAIPVINCVNVYPNLKLWQRIDPQGTFEQAYNRYAYINMHLGSETSFQVPQPDLLDVTIRPDDVPKLGVTHWLSTEDLSPWNTETTRFEPVVSSGPYTVYAVTQAPSPGNKAPA